jgi:hypothetical protein
MDAEKKKSNLWCPDVSTRDGARGAALGGALTACIVAVVTTGFALYATLKEPVLNITPLSFVDAVLFGAIAFGIWRLSRAAALAGLALYLMEQGYQWATVGPRSPVSVLGVWML